jgi:hypothetical protein
MRREAHRVGTERRLPDVVLIAAATGFQSGAELSW